MLAIKLKKIGKKHQRAFRIIVAEKRSKVGGNFVEDIGTYNPREKKTSINKERALYWIDKGAQPTDTIHNILVKEQIINSAKIPVHNVKGHNDALAAKTAKADEKPEQEEPVAETEAAPQEESSIEATTEPEADVPTEEAPKEE